MEILMRCVIVFYDDSSTRNYFICLRVSGVALYLSRARHRSLVPLDQNQINVYQIRNLYSYIITQNSQQIKSEEHHG